MQAFWCARQNRHDPGDPESDHGPLMPKVGPGVKWVAPCDINVLTGSTPSPHRHLLAGAIAVPSSQAPAPYETHYHEALRVGSIYFQRTVGAPDHTHDDNEYPEYYLVFALCTDPAYDLLIAAGVEPIVHCNVSVDNGIASINSMDDVQWTAQELSSWQTKALNLLGLSLPSQIDRGKRLVLYILGLTLSRRLSDDASLRFNQIKVS